MFEEIKNLLAEEMSINPADVKEESEFVNDLGFNSLELADLVVLCEDKYGVDIDEEKAHMLITVGDFTKYLTELVNAK